MERNREGKNKDFVRRMYIGKEFVGMWYGVFVYCNWKSKKKEFVSGYVSYRVKLIWQILISRSNAHL